MTKNGANSACSFVRNVILIEKKDFKDVFLLSDSCTDQNRNWVIASVLSALAKEENISITQVFPVRGQWSQLLSETTETVDEYVSIIESAKKTGNPFIVPDVQFVTLKNMSKYINPKSYLYPSPLCLCNMTEVEI